MCAPCVPWKMALFSLLQTTEDFNQFLKAVWLKPSCYFEFLVYFLTCLVVHWVASAGLGWLAAAVCCKVLYNTWGDRNKAAGTPEAAERRPVCASGQSSDSTLSGETTEWLNKMACKLWPYVSDYIYDNIMFSNKKPDWVKDVTLNEDSPFSLRNIKVLDQPQEEIVLDMAFVFAGKFKIDSSLRIPCTVILKVEGKLRVVMKPLLGQIPFTGGLQLFFPEEPQVKFVCRPVQTVINLLGLKNWLCQLVEEKIVDQMVAPKCFPVLLVEDIPIEELEQISPAALLMEQQSDSVDGWQREEAQGCDTASEHMSEGTQEAGTSLPPSQDNTSTPAANDVDTPARQSVFKNWKARWRKPRRGARSKQRNGPVARMQGMEATED